MDSIDDFAKKITRKMNRIRNQMKENLPPINNEIDAIIEREDKSTDKIEQLLDTLLDYIQLGIGENEFRRLNDYYSTFNPGNAKIYTKFYKEMKDDENKT